MILLTDEVLLSNKTPKYVQPVPRSRVFVTILWHFFQPTWRIKSAH